jgi:hypothetical protein
LYHAVVMKWREQSMLAKPLRLTRYATRAPTQPKKSTHICVGFLGNTKIVCQYFWSAY